jgi:hypothetical protein
VRPSVRLPLALSLSGLVFWLLFGFVSTWWAGVLALAAPVIALRCLPLSKGIPLSLANVLLGMIAAHVARTRGFADVPLEIAAMSAAVVTGVALLARVVTTWRPRSGWLFVPASVVVVDRLLGVDLYRHGAMDGSSLSSWSHDLARRLACCSPACCSRGS